MDALAMTANLTFLISDMKINLGIWGVPFYANKSFSDSQMLCLGIKFNYQIASKQLINTYQNEQKLMERT